MDYYKVIGERIGILRTKHNESQGSLAKAIGVSLGEIQNWEGNKRKIKIPYLIEIAKHYGVSIDYLSGVSDIETTSTDKRAVCEYLGLTDGAVEMLSLVMKDNQLVTAFEDTYELEAGYTENYQQCINTFLSGGMCYSLFVCLGSLLAQSKIAQKAIADYNNETDPLIKKSYRKKLVDISKRMKVSEFYIMDSARDIAHEFDNDIAMIRYELNKIILNSSLSELSEISENP